MNSFDFLSPKTLSEALDALAVPGSRAIAGGTDVIPQLQTSRFQAGRLVDLGRLSELRYIREEDTAIEIGALTRYADILNSDLLARYAPALVTASQSVGAMPTRNRGTIGGNVVNASPAGDTLPPLLVLDAGLKLVSRESERQLAIEEFLLAPGKTNLEAGEILHSVFFTKPPAHTYSTFLKLGNRHGMAISVVSVAVLVTFENNGVVKDARIALGAVAPTAIRVSVSEASVVGSMLGQTDIAKAARIASEQSAPIDDIRASAVYRRHAVEVLVRRGLQNIKQQLGESGR